MGGSQELGWSGVVESDTLDDEAYRCLYQGDIRRDVRIECMSKRESS